MTVMSSRNTNNNQSILEGPIRAMPQLTERNQLMQFIIYILTYASAPPQAIPSA